MPGASVPGRRFTAMVRVRWVSRRHPPVGDPDGPPIRRISAVDGPRLVAGQRLGGETDLEQFEPEGVDATDQSLQFGLVGDRVLTVVVP